MSESVLIIGASSDIGGEIARELASAGRTVIAHYNRGGEKIEKLRREVVSRVIPVQADLSRLEGIEQLIHSLDELGGVPEGVVFVAAPRVRNIRFRDLRWEDFHEQLTVQLCAASEVLRHFLPLMAKRKRGRIVFILTSYTIAMPPPALAHYITAKYSLLGLMKALSSEYAAKGININAVSPSMVETSFLADIPERIVEMAAERHPMGRNARPEDVAPLVKFLLSEDAGYITGVNIPVTGGSLI